MACGNFNYPAQILPIFHQYLSNTSSKSSLCTGYLNCEENNYEMHFWGKPGWAAAKQRRRESKQLIGGTNGPTIEGTID